MEEHVNITFPAQFLNRELQIPRPEILLQPEPAHQFLGSDRGAGQAVGILLG